MFTQRRPLGSAGLFLDFLMIASLALICFTFWVSVLFLRLLLYYLNYLSTTTLLDWPTRMVCSLLLVHLKLFDYHYWISITLVQFTLRLLLVLVILDLIRISFLLPSFFERALEYYNLFHFILFCSWYLHNLSVICGYISSFSVFFLGASTPKVYL